jgi:hypothetical protein
MEESRQHLTVIFKEPGISDIILEYKKDLDVSEINDMRMRLFDIRFSRKMPFYTRDDLSTIWSQAQELLVENDGKKYNIHNIYQRLDNIEKEIDKIKQIQSMERRIDNKEREFLSFFG